MKKITKMVLYLRLSRKRKGRSKEQTANEALGIEAQRAAGQALAKQHGAKIVAEYIEIETGTSKRERPKMAVAIQDARVRKATLVIAKLDRLARNVKFTATLLESGVDFVCCDMPEANTMTIQMMAVMAEQEARAIGARTRDALAVAKKNGVKLGSARPGHWKGIEHKRGWKAANKASAEARSQRANDSYGFLWPSIKEMRDAGKGLQEIADWLNEQGHTTTREKPFTFVAVHRIIDRFKDAA